MSFGAEVTALSGTLPEDHLPRLKAILAAAWLQSPEAIEKQFELAAADAQVIMADAGRWPHLGGWADYASNETSVSGQAGTRTRDSGLFYRFEVSQPIFRWGELKNRSAAARIDALVAARSYVEVFRLLALHLRAAYLDLISKKGALRQARFAQELAAADFAVAQDKFAHGGIPEGELKGRELFFREQAVRLARQESDFVALCRTFARLAGQKDFTEEELPNEMPRPVYAPELAKLILAEALRAQGKFSWEAEFNELRANEANLNYKIARVNLLPKFGLTAGYSLLNNTNATSNSVSQTGVAQQTVGVHMEWPIFDGFSTRGQIRNALANRRLYEQRAKNAAEAALETLQQRERNLGFDAQLLDLKETSLAISHGVEDHAQAEFKLGNLSQREVSRATANRMTSEIDAGLARAAFLGEWSEYVSLAGIDPLLNALPARYVREKR